jgi:hypothetical protein
MPKSLGGSHRFAAWRRTAAPILPSDHKCSDTVVPLLTLSLEAGEFDASGSMAVANPLVRGTGEQNLVVGPPSARRQLPPASPSWSELEEWWTPT